MTAHITGAKLLQIVNSFHYENAVSKTVENSLGLKKWCLHASFVQQICFTDSCTEHLKNKLESLSLTSCKSLELLIIKNIFLYVFEYLKA